MMPSSSRLERTRAAVTKAGLDALLITDIVNTSYITGFTGSTASALVGPNVAIVIVDTRYTLRARAECAGFEVLTLNRSVSHTEALKELLAPVPNLRKVGFEKTHTTVDFWEKLRCDLPGIEWVGTEKIVEGLRAIKDDAEVETIRRAIDVAEEAFTAAKPYLLPGISERDFAVEIDFAMRRRGADAPAFETIVASGPNAAYPHHSPGKRVIQPGDWVIVDWGATVDGYHSDLTRTFLIGPKSAGPVDADRRYDIVRGAQQAAIDAIAPGKNGKEIDAVARDFLAAAGLADSFRHSLGHDLGRLVHDGPGLSVRAAENILQPGMVLTVEPGIYIEDWGGIRIEEDVVVTQTGCEVLTHLSNGFEILG
ncbi:MAG: M24 family metallopeptidase [Capsulimonadaceae bacterium]